MKRSYTFITALLLTVTTFHLSTAKDKKSAQHNLQVKVKEMTSIEIKNSGTSTNITLNPASPSEAGMGVDFTNAENSDLWLCYSSIAKKNKTRIISASITGNLPGGTSLMVNAAQPSGNGKGALGNANQVKQELNEKETVIVSDIGSCYTGTGKSDGCNLTYQLDMDLDAYASLLKGSYRVQVTYTISE